MPAPDLRRLAGARETTVVPAPSDQVWAILRDPTRTSDWHPAARPAQGPQSPHPGLLRAFDLAPDLLLIDVVLGVSDRNRVLSAVMTAPEVLAGGASRIRVLPVTFDGSSFVEWSLDLRAGAAEPELQALLRNALLRDGLRGLTAACMADRGGWNPPTGKPREPATGSASHGAWRTVGAPLVQLPPTLPEGHIAARVMRAERRGGPEVLRAETLAVPMPGPGEVRLAQRFAGVNFLDLACLAGNVGMMPLPGVPGLEGVGTVDRAGAGVTDLVPGDRVAYVGPPVGSYSSHRLLPRDLLVRLPGGMPDEVAAAMLLKGNLAGLLLHDVHPLRAGETVAVLSAAGGVGQILVQWATALGARVIAVVSGPAKALQVRALGAWAVVDRADEDFAAAVLRMTDGRGADLVLDGIGRATLAGSLAAARTGGHVVSFGTASGAPGPITLEALAARSLTLSRPSYGHYSATADARARLADRLFEAVAAGMIAPAEPTILPLSEAAQALQSLARAQSTGAIVLDCRGK